MLKPETPDGGLFQSHVISWNLTQRCNLKCEHCYIEGGPIQKAMLAGEMTTEQCLRTVDQISEINPNALVIFTGGEPLLRPDVFEIVQYASDKGLWCVMGTNGVLVTERLVDKMIEVGIRGVSLSLDSMDPEVHDAFRRVRGAWRNTVRGSRILKERGLPYIIQTTVGIHNLDEIQEIARFAHKLGARVFNLFFLVPTGRGTFISDIEPAEYEGALHTMMAVQKEFDGRMLINAKCAPHYQRVLYENEPDSKFLKSFAAGAGGCPAGTHYAGIRPDGKVTPCPYLPQYGGNLKEKSFNEIWRDSDLFRTIRARKQLGGRCGSCEFNAACGGCRARAFGHVGDILAEDPWCIYKPGRFGGEEITFAQGNVYGLVPEEAEGQEIVWQAAAKDRLQAVPSFVRGMVIRRVEDYARREGRREITPALMDEIRARMPVRFPRFGRKPGVKV
ncbi:MAG: radical SAM protein [Acidobacteriota bacterium]|nr:radical SAM protein [Acidobacteriota bacterium]